MNKLQVNAVFKLRRDNDYNYKKIENTFIPLNGEVCLVDTSNCGLRVKVGDGINTFANLPFSDEDIARNVIIRGYLSDNKFYSDADLTMLIEASVNKIYIGAKNNIVYIFDGEKYTPITQTIPAASTSIAGVMKLYDTVGQNTDGTMSQKAITDELNEKVEIKTDIENELLTFFTD